MPRFQNQDVIEIIRDGALLHFAPQAGGRLLSWQLDGQSVIHWPDDANWERPAGVRGGNPLLFPFLGRHRVDGEIGRWRDAAGAVRDVPMHGFARDLPFTAEVSADGHALSMVLTDSEATRTGYPFGFRFEVIHRLVDASTLDIAFVTSNTGTERLPYYAGHHFYFTLPRAQRATSVIELPPTHYCHQQADGSISERTPGQPSYRFDQPEIIDRFHCLDGVPARPIRLRFPEQGRVIDIDLARPDSVPWYVVTTWTEKPESDFFCVEPWLGLPDAIHNGQGLRWLEPGQTETASLRLQIKTLVG